MQWPPSRVVRASLPPESQLIFVFILGAAVLAFWIVLLHPTPTAEPALEEVVVNCGVIEPGQVFSVGQSQHGVTRRNVLFARVGTDYCLKRCRGKVRYPPDLSSEVEIFHTMIATLNFICMLEPLALVNKMRRTPVPSLQTLQEKS